MLTPNGQTPTHFANSMGSSARHSWDHPPWSSGPPTTADCPRTLMQNSDRELSVITGSTPTSLPAVTTNLDSISRANYAIVSSDPPRPALDHDTQQIFIRVTFEPVVHHICTTKACRSVQHAKPATTGRFPRKCWSAPSRETGVQTSHKAPSTIAKPHVTGYFWVARSGSAPHLHHNAHRGRNSHQKLSRHALEEPL